MFKVIRELIPEKLAGMISQTDFFLFMVIGFLLLWLGKNENEEETDKPPVSSTSNNLSTGSINNSSSAVGNKIEQHFHFPEYPLENRAGAIANVQTMTDSPGGIQAGGDVNITGRALPPPRFITQSKFATAVSILKTAPAGSKVSFIIVGGGNEITAITKQIQGLFTAARDKWEIIPGSFIGSLNMSVITDSGVEAHHGEGINCTFGSSETLAYHIGVRAMEAAGIQCGSQHFTADNSTADISIMIGTRIVPEE
jgi:hypothetical protein